MKAKTNSVPTGDEFTNLVNLLAVHSEAANRMAVLDAELQGDWMATVDQHRREYATLQSKVSESQAAIEVMAARHPEWFESVRTVKTPYGDVSLRSSTKLEVPNEELTLALIGRRDDSELFTRTRTFLNIEALESLEDHELKTLKISRVTTDKCTVKPMKVDLGKAVKLAEKGAES